MEQFEVTLKDYLVAPQKSFINRHKYFKDLWVVQQIR